MPITYESLICVFCHGEVGEKLDLATGEQSCNCGKTFFPDIDVPENIDELI